MEESKLLLLAQERLHGLEMRHAREARYLDQMRADPDDRRHGTSFGYALGCRCEACREANNRKAREYRKKGRMQ